MNAVISQMATGLSTCVLKDGQQTLTGNIPFGGFKVTGLGAGTAPADAVRFDQLSAAAADFAFSQTALYSSGSIGVSLQRFPSVKDAPYYAKGDGIADDTAAIQACLDDNNAAFLPVGSYVCAGLVFGSHDVIVGADRYLATLANLTNAATITITGNYNSIRNLGFSGSGKGATYNAGQLSNIGVSILGGGTAGYNNIVDNCYFAGFGRAGYKIEQTNGAAHRGNQFTNNLCFSNNSGIEAAVQGEYVNCSGTNCEQNNYGMYIRGGNFLAPGVIITDNLTGVYLASGANDSHGVISGAHINHNVDYNIQSEAITNGFTFDACHCYEGDILYTGAVGIQFQNGTLDVINFYFDGSTGCTFRNNLLPGGYANTINNDYNGHASWTKWEGNRPLNGIQPSAEIIGGYSSAVPTNTTHLAGFAETTMDFTTPTNSVYNQGTFTKYQFWDSVNKWWTVRGLGRNVPTVRGQIRISINAADNPNNLYIYLRKNGTTNIGYLTRTIVNATVVAFNLPGNLELGPSETVELRIGTATALANSITVLTAAPSSIQLEGL